MRKIKRIIITGAGFSAPANLPIQNRIIDNMTKDEETASFDFLAGGLPEESLKFLDAYIVVGLFLLDNYSRKDYSELAKDYKKLRAQKLAFETLTNSNSNDMMFPFFYNDMSSLEKDRVKFDYYSLMYTIRNNVRQAIRDEKISVNLEDVFTSFDKTMITKEYLHKYTYVQMDEVRFALTSLFIYYFSLRVNEHDYQNQDYLDFFNYINKRRSKEPETIITTNWDTLIEEYCNRLNISFSYGFDYPYTSDIKHDDTFHKITLLKIHGSINWLRCLHCGGLSVFNGIEAAASLFNDDHKEKCMLCNHSEMMEAPSLQPEIITPTMLKSLSNQVYVNLWGVAGRELRKATHIIFIGYSLPMADYDFRYMLQKNVPIDASIDVILTQNSNPKSIKNEAIKRLLPESRYREAFPKNNIRFYYDGFGNYFSQN